MRRFSNLSVLLVMISAGAFGSTGDAHRSAGVTFAFGVTKGPDILSRLSGFVLHGPH